MGNNRKVDTSFLYEYREEFDELFDEYLDEINSNIIQYEVIANAAPVAILNEIRAIMSHMARIALANTPENAEENLKKMKGHSTRAKLDCYKYMCMAIAKRKDAFFNRYNGIDYSRINNGEFAVNIADANEVAEKRLIEAKTYESENGPDEKLYDKYAEAYLEYKKVWDLIKIGEKYAPQLNREYEQKQEDEKIASLYGKRGYIVGIAGMIIGVVGIAVGILGLIL